MNRPECPREAKFLNSRTKLSALLPSYWLLVAWTVVSCCHLACAQSAPTTNTFIFEDILLAPLRVHLLQGEGLTEVHTSLTAEDVSRVLKKVNGIWAQAGLHFYLESLVREKAITNSYEPTQIQAYARDALLRLRPPASKAADMFHVYYIKRMDVNGVYLGEAMFVKDTASLRRVEGGIDEPIPRVTSHELGHALSLGHHTDATNLMMRGTTGTRLSPDEIKQARAAARQFSWIEPAARTLQRARDLERANKAKEAAPLYERLAALPQPISERQVR